jgi:putative Mg2+ transporter-C (MgtC) family protein
MRFLDTFQFYDFLDTLISLGTAFVLGTLIGAERQFRLRTAGLRTNVLVAVSAAAFIDLAMQLGEAKGAIHVIAYVVSGIGFLGAGVIMKEGTNVRGLNTAATLWGSAAVGCCAGADMIVQAITLTMFVLAGNTLLRPLVNAINRAPLTPGTSEVTYEFKLTADADKQADLRAMLLKKLGDARYPVSDVIVTQQGHGEVEIVATLVSTTVVSGDLDRLSDEIGRLPGVRHAGWEASTQT